MYKSQNKIVSKIVEKLRMYRIISLKDILLFLGPDYIDASLQYSKNQINRTVISLLKGNFQN